jgi:hypothetical protein
MSRETPFITNHIALLKAQLPLHDDNLQRAAILTIFGYYQAGMITQDVLVQLFTAQDNQGWAPVHLIASRKIGAPLLIKTLLMAVDEDARVALVSARCSDGCTAVNFMVGKKGSDIQCLFDFLGDKLKSILKLKTNKQSTFMHTFNPCYDADYVRQALAILGDDAKEVLKAQGNGGYTALYFLIRSFPAAWRKAFDRLDDAAAAVLQIQATATGISALHALAQVPGVDWNEVYQILGADVASALLLQNKINGRTVLHDIAEFNPGSFMRALSSLGLGAARALQLEDGVGDTPLHIFARCCLPHQDWAPLFEAVGEPKDGVWLCKNHEDETPLLVLATYHYSHLKVVINHLDCSAAKTLQAAMLTQKIGLPEDDCIKYLNGLLKLLETCEYSDFSSVLNDVQRSGVKDFSMKQTKILLQHYSLLRTLYGTTLVDFGSGLFTTTTDMKSKTGLATAAINALSGGSIEVASEYHAANEGTLGTLLAMGHVTVKAMGVAESKGCDADGDDGYRAGAGGEADVDGEDGIRMVSMSGGPS